MSYKELAEQSATYAKNIIELQREVIRLRKLLSDVLGAWQRGGNYEYAVIVDRAKDELAKNNPLLLD